MTTSGPTDPLRDRVALTGVGATHFSRNSSVTVAHLAVEACLAAIADAGLSRDDVDGLVCFHDNDTSLTRDVATALRLPRLRWWSDVSVGGNFACGAIAQGAMAIATGMARHVVVYRAMNGRSGKRMGQFGGSRTDGAYQFLAPYGFGTPAQIFGMFARRHMTRFGTTREDLGRIAITMRTHAELNARAVRREPLTMDEYLSGRVIADPFTLYDCCQETDGAVAILLSPAEAARDLPHRPVYLHAAVHGAGDSPRLPFDRWDDFSTSCFGRLADELFDKSEFTRADVDFACLYDAFTFEILHQLEEIGFCGRGEGAGFVRDGNISLGGRLPVNPHGGLLSEGYIHGLNHTLEAVEQLRGASGARQVPDARVALVTAYGFVSGGLLLLRN
ncbi:acetyl-CoA acetyltransferase-like protein [Mycolicibacterium rhodesiae JS60]|nr:acetyl-CoA acetyltransferase-like protein [Mycolicibacterium rhodesiae JS60]